MQTVKKGSLFIV